MCECVYEREKLMKYSTDDKFNNNLGRNAEYSLIYGGAFVYSFKDS